MLFSTFRSHFARRFAAKTSAPLFSLVVCTLAAVTNELHAAASCAPGQPIRAIKSDITSSSGAPTIDGSSTLGSYPTSYSSGGQAEQFYPTAYVTYEASLTPVGTTAEGKIKYHCRVSAKSTVLPPFCSDPMCFPQPQPVGLNVTPHAGLVFDGDDIDLPPNYVCDIDVRIIYGLQNNSNGAGHIKTPGKTLDASADFENMCPGDYEIRGKYTDGSTNETGEVQLDQVHIETGEFSYKTGLAFPTGTGPFTKDGVTYTFNSIFAQPACPAGEPGGSGASLGSVRFWMNLGRTTADHSAGAIRVDADSITAAIYTPRALFIPKSLVGVLPIYNGAVPRQVRAPQTFADIVVIDASTYEIRFFTPDQAGSPDETTGIYSPSGSPYAVYKFENPDAAIPATSRIRITETRGATTKVTEFSYDPATSTWTFSQGNGLHQESSVTTFFGGDRIKTITIKNDANQVSSKTKRTYRRFAWGEELIKEVLDPDGAALTTNFEFYDTTTSDPNYSHLKQQTNADGSWVRYTYDAAGHALKTIQPFLDTDPTTTDESLCRVTEKIYDTIADVDGDSAVEKRITTIERTLGTETARRYRIDWSKRVTLNSDSCTRRSDIVCTVSGAAWDASSNLVTETLRYTSDDFLERERRVVRPDGTATITSYTIDGPLNETATTKTGQPNSGLTDIVDGTRTVTVTSYAGQVTGETVTDIASNLELSSWTATTFDNLKRPTFLQYTDTTYITRSYACCGLESERDRSGVTTTMNYDALGQRTTITRDGITIATGYDADGRMKTVTRIGTDLSTITQETDTYDLAGRLITRADALNRTTNFAESFDAGTSHLTRTTTNPDSGTTIEVFARDGSRLSVSGTAAVPHNFEYGVDADGVFVKNIAVGESGGSPTTTEWTKTYVDFASRPFKTVFADSATIQLFYSSAGQLARQVDPDGIATLFAYNARGELQATAIDINANGAIDYTGADRITKTTRTVATKTDGGTYTVQRATTQIWETNGADTPVTVSITEQSSDGLRSWQTNRGLTTRAVTILDNSGGRTTTTTTPDGVKTIQEFAADRLLSTTVKTAADVQVVKATYAYDSHHRLQSATDDRNGATTFAYFDDDQIHSVTTPDPDTSRSGDGYDPQTTSYTYNSAGRVDTVTQPDGGVVNTTYYPTGAVKRVSGARTYPVEYSYDPQGRVKTLTTWQNYAGDSGKAVTTWNYDPQRGWLSNKRHNDNTGPSYSYKPSGRLLTRTWARTPAITTTYSYDAAGDFNGTDYSDATPDVTISRDRLGRTITITDASGSRTLGYHTSGQLESESYTSGALNALAVNRSFDAIYRLSGIAVPSVVSAAYGYDDASRLHTVTRGSNTATYAYAANSSLVESITFAESSATRLTTAKVYDKLNRLTSITNTPSAAPASSHTYTYNSANQRTRATREDGGYWNYTYDALGQVTNGSKYLFGGAALSGFAYGYTYDDIGNRKTATTNGQVATYSPTLLNSYSQRTVPGVVDVVGAADPDATVTISVGVVPGTPVKADRQGDVYYKQLAFDNSAGPQYPFLTIIGLKNAVGPDGLDEMESAVKAPHLAQNPEVFTYDADGNLTDDAKWHYTWDGENRLIAMESRELTAPTYITKQKLEFAYDAQGRRFDKKVYAWNPSTSSFQLSTETKFLYDGWNLLADLNGQASNAILCTYVWGLDLSNSFQRAGGVGGLLFSTLPLDTATHAYAYDGNGNVSALINLMTGIKDAAYEYSAFGDIIAIEGEVASSNRIRFSSRYADDETTQIYYGFRYYNPEVGRWLSRDPVRETGGVNLYGFVGNNATALIDVLGLADEEGDILQQLTDNYATVNGALPAARAYSNALYNTADVALKTGGEVIKWEVGLRVAGTFVRSVEGGATIFKALSGESIVIKTSATGEKVAVRTLPNGKKILLSKGPAEALEKEVLALEKIKKVEVPSCAVKNATRTVALDSNAFYSLGNLRKSGILQPGDELIVTPSVQAELFRHGVTANDLSSAGIKMLSESPTGISVPATRLAEILRGFGGPGAASASSDALNVAEAAGLRADVFLTNDRQVLRAFQGGVTLPNTAGISINVTGF